MSHVLSGYEHVSTRMHDNVMSAVTELDYEVNISARNLRSGRTRVIGLAVPELSQAHFAELANAVIRAATARDYTVLTEQTSTDNDNIATVAAMRRPVDQICRQCLGGYPQNARMSARAS